MTISDLDEYPEEKLLSTKKKAAPSEQSRTTERPFIWEFNFGSLFNTNTMSVASNNTNPIPVAMTLTNNEVGQSRYTLIFQ